MHRPSSLFAAARTEAQARLSPSARSFVRRAAGMTLSVLIAIAVAGPAVAAESRAGEIANKTADALLLRPGGVLRLAVGSAFMIPASLFSLAAIPSQGMSAYDEMLEVLVLEPFRYTFQRPFGEDLAGN